MDKRSLKDCIAVASHELFIGIRIAHVARLLMGWGRSSVTRSIVVGGVRSGWRVGLDRILNRVLGHHHLDEAYMLPEEPNLDYLDERDPDALAAILYTSGSTGTPKGARYLHRHFRSSSRFTERMLRF